MVTCSFLLVSCSVPPGLHGYCWSYHVLPGYVMIPSGRLLYISVLACCFWSQFCDGFVTVVARSTCVCDRPATVQGQNNNDFVTVVASLTIMGGSSDSFSDIFGHNFWSLMMVLVCSACFVRFCPLLLLVLSDMGRLTPLDLDYGFCQEPTHFQQDEFDVTCDHFMEPTGFEINMHFLRGSRSLLELISQKGSAWIEGKSLSSSILASGEACAYAFCHIN
ncbi:hypothetical protein Tco_0680599 [Tanacetum coccineum]|uniref:Uncharacterized protein n=1 Tax=Tanacetum coccineum TaxID=301880 RepID=A0ABQ4XM42_9ASTR